MQSKGKTILIADDEPDILEILSYNLRNDGYTMHTACDGEEALLKAPQVAKEDRNGGLPPAPIESGFSTNTDYIPYCFE